MNQQAGAKRIAVIGSGIAGMSAAWLLAHRHEVVLYEAAPRLGGHTRSVAVPGVAAVENTGSAASGMGWSAAGGVGGSAASGMGGSAAGGVVHQAAGSVVDIGFIVYNEATYPNLVALFSHLGVATRASEMSFAASLRGGQREYAGTNLAGLFAQPSNALSPRFWGMLRDLLRFYREAPRDAAALERDLISLGAYVQGRRHGAGFVQDHLLPMAAAIWSTPAAEVGAYPATAFIRFCENHGLLQLTNRPVWRTVVGGSGAYIPKLTAPYADNIRLGCGVVSLTRHADHVLLRDSGGDSARYDEVVIASHAPQALAMLADPSDAEAALLGSIRTAPNRVVLHRDPGLMPRRRRAWASWNYLDQPDGSLCVTYWMNHLMGLAGPRQHFVTLNPQGTPTETLHEESLAHPQFDAAALRAQRALWSLQGIRRTWFCGAWFGAGFHEDGLQAGLAVAEQLGGMQRPWAMPAQPPRIHAMPRRVAPQEVPA